jgi:cell division septal protein FtsQ
MLPRISRRLLLAAAAILAGVLLWVGTPRVLRRVAFFRVRQLELVGIRHLAPDVVIDALRLRPAASVFDDTDRLTDRVRGVTGVADARVTRRLPGALKVIVREVEPVALVPGGGGGGGAGGALVAVDQDGRALPFEPTRSGLDLPVVAGGDTDVVGLLARIRAVDPALFQDIAAAREWARHDAVLELGEGARRVLVARDAGPEVITAVVQVLQDLARRGRSYAELDARYAGQVVVRRKASA